MKGWLKETLAELKTDQRVTEEYRNSSDLEKCQQMFSDNHKDAYGFRPRINTSSWTVEDFEVAIDDLRFYMGSQ